MVAPQLIRIPFNCLHIAGHVIAMASAVKAFDTITDDSTSYLCANGATYGAVYGGPNGPVFSPTPSGLIFWVIVAFVFGVSSSLYDLFRNQGDMNFILSLSSGLFALISLGHGAKQSKIGDPESPACALGHQVNNMAAWAIISGCLAIFLSLLHVMARRSSAPAPAK